MAVFLCPHCDDVIELLGDGHRPAPQCDCGGLMEPVDAGEAIQQHPDYHHGFYDAQAGEPIWPEECAPEYAAGWNALWECRAIVGAGSRR